MHLKRSEKTKDWMSTQSNKTGKKRLRRRTGTGTPPPPAQHRFRPGNQAARGHGRPKGPADYWGRVDQQISEISRTVGPRAAREYADSLARSFVQRLIAGDFRFWMLLLDRDDYEHARRRAHERRRSGAARPPAGAA